MYGKPEIQSMLRGAMQGQQALAGMIPSSNDVGGASPDKLDPAGYLFDTAHDTLMALSQKLKTYRDDVASNRIGQLAIKVKDEQLDRRKKLADEQANGGGEGGNAASSVGSLNAMGVPGGQ